MFRKIKEDKKGFTLAELLIVVAIIAVLVAIAIPVFTQQLEKAREATDIANVRSAYAGVMSDYLQKGSGTSVTVTAQQKTNGWVSGDAFISADIGSFSKKISIPAKGANGSWTITVDDAGTISIS